MFALSIGHNYCIRAAKESLALMLAGHPVHTLVHQVANQEIRYLLPSMEFYADAGHLARKVAYSQCTLIHVHNEPDWMVGCAKIERPDLPVVYDCHDLGSVRWGEASDAEFQAMELADAYIFPSYTYMEEACRFHKLHERFPDKAKEVVYSLPLSGWKPTPLPRLGGVVYQGGCTVDVDGRFVYRDYREIADGLAEINVQFFIFARNNGNNRDSYFSRGAVWIESLPYTRMLQQLTRFDWGLVGCSVPHPQWMKAMPNKLFEYILAGIPVVCINAAECAEFVREHQIGVVLDDIRGLAEVATEIREECRQSVLKIRDRFVMETQVEKILHIYQMAEDYHRRKDAMGAIPAAEGAA